MNDAKSLEQTIEHEVGHNWFYGILASNERANVWMDEGFNNYYDARYNNLYHIQDSITDYVPPFLAKKTDYSGSVSRYRRNWEEGEFLDSIANCGFRVIDKAFTNEADRGKKWLGLVLKRG